MFDVDGTLSLARLAAKPEMHAALAKLRTITAVAIVGGSDMKKIREQLEIPGEECESLSVRRSELCGGFGRRYGNERGWKLTMQ